MLKYAVFLFLLFSLSGHSAFPQPSPTHYICYQTASRLTIDGNMQETAWQAAPWSGAFVDIEGARNPKPYYTTRMKMLWDDKYLYIAAEMEEPHLWATYDQRDMVIFHENDFEVFIDPDGDTHNYYELEINALGTVWDLMLTKPYRNGGRAVDAWHIRGLQSAVAMQGTLNNGSDQDEKWTVELAFPWEVLEECAPRGEKPREGDQWRINFSRVQWRTEWKNGQYQKKIDPVTGNPFPEHNWVWVPQGAINMHMPEHWGFVQFSKKRVGQGSEQFRLHSSYRIKTELREWYYAQHRFRKEQGTFALGKADLMPHLNHTGSLNPTIHAGKSFFVISAIDPATAKTWIIREDGWVGITD